MIFNKSICNSGIYIWTTFYLHKLFNYLVDADKTEEEVELILVWVTNWNRHVHVDKDDIV